MALIVADRLFEQGFNVVFQSNHPCHPILRRHPHISRYESPNARCHINLDGVPENSNEKWIKTETRIFLESAYFQLAHYGITIDVHDGYSSLNISYDDLKSELVKLSHYDMPWVMINGRSATRSNCNITNAIIEQSAPRIRGSKFWIGMEKCPSGLIDCEVRDIDRLIRLIACADVLISPDTGPMHIAALIGIPIVAIENAVPISLRLNEPVDYVVVSADTGCYCSGMVCHKNMHYPPCFKINPIEIAISANEYTQHNHSNFR